MQTARASISFCVTEQCCLTFPKSLTSKRSKASNSSLLLMPNTSLHAVRKVLMFFRHRNCGETERVHLWVSCLEIFRYCSMTCTNDTMCYYLSFFFSFLMPNAFFLSCFPSFPLRLSNEAVQYSRHTGGKIDESVFMGTMRATIVSLKWCISCWNGAVECCIIRKRQFNIAGTERQRCYWLLLLQYGVRYCATIKSNQMTAFHRLLCCMYIFGCKGLVITWRTLNQSVNLWCVLSIKFWVSLFSQPCWLSLLIPAPKFMLPSAWAC